VLLYLLPPAVIVVVSSDSFFDVVDFGLAILIVYLL
jgi:hypothetical protein